MTRRRTLATVVAAAALAAGLTTGVTRSRAADPPPTPPGAARHGKVASIADYYTELARIGLIDTQSGSREALSADLGRAEAILEAGDPAGAAVLLYAIVESPKYTDFAEFPEYQNAEYDLAVALAASGAYENALGYVDKVLARGPSALYFAAAHRRAVDIAIETRDYRGVLGELEGVKLNEPLPVEAAAERGYLEARALYDEGKYDQAEGELARIGRKSRLYSSALYLRGVIRARKGEFADADAALCEIAETPDNDRYTFYVDDRYFKLKDLARLGLGRIAHEQGRYDDAYYHYFQIPDDSDRLPEALFEAAWSMYQKRELATARDLVAEFEKTFPDSPLIPEAMLLAGYIELADCKFDDAKKKFDQAVTDLQPVVDETEAISRSPGRRRALFDRAFERERERKKDPEAALARAKARTAEDRVLVMLRIDPRFGRLHEAAFGLRREAADAGHVVAIWRQLAGRMLGTGTDKVAPAAQTETADQAEARRAAELYADVRRLREQIHQEKIDVQSAVADGRMSKQDAETRLAKLDSVDMRLADLEQRAARTSEAADKKLVGKSDPKLASMVDSDLDGARTLERRALDLAAKLDDAADGLALKALGRTHADLRRVIDKAKLGRIDAVIGQKRRAEIEAEDLAQGHYPPELFGKLLEDGVIGDDEEYWPQEGEYWKDEYEGYR